MKYLIILISVILLYISFYFLRILYYSNYSSDPQISQQETTFGTGPELKYIAAGDSTAVGQGASSVENTYTYRIAKSLSETNTVEYKNIAVRGAQTTDLLEQQLPQIIDFQPDIITISIGANDATHLISQAKIFENYQEIIRKLSTETTAKIYITNIANFNGASLLPYPFIKFIEWRSGKINPAINNLESERVKIINIHDFGWENYPDLSLIYSSDHFHPNDIGYDNWYKAFWDKVSTH